MLLRIENLSKTYANGTRALDNVSLDIEQGMFGLLGPNGAGKSTLMRIIATLQEPDKEKARAKKLHVAHYMTGPNAAQLAEIGALLQEGRIKPHIFATYPLEDAARAEIVLAKEHVRGKIVLTINP